MKYFTKWLPVEGEIKEGDMCLTKEGNIVQVEGDGHATHELEYSLLQGDKKVKLFLCSRDIQVGDTIYEPDKPWKIVDIVRGENEGTVDYALSVGAFKVIGEISPDALSYVKEGMEYEDKDVMLAYSNPFGILGKMNVYIRNSSCGHFH